MKHAKVLIIVDRGQSATSYQEALAEGFTLEISDAPEDALRSIAAANPEITIWAAHESVQNPLDLAKSIRDPETQPTSSYMGLIFISQREISDWLEKSLGAGMDLCLQRSWTVPQLRAAMQTCLRICEAKHELAEANQKLSRAVDRLRKLSVTDELTGLYNMRFLNRQLNIEFKRAQRYQKHLTLLIIDLDAFKTVNDSCDYQMGNYVLSQVAQNIADSLRFEIDYIARTGADAFFVILPETDLVGSISVAERLRRRIEESTFSKMAHRVNVTASVGLAQFNGDRSNFQNLEDFVATAHKAVQMAKDHGGNQYCALDAIAEEFQSLERPA